VVGAFAARPLWRAACGKIARFRCPLSDYPQAGVTHLRGHGAAATVGGVEEELNGLWHAAALDEHQGE
jgi:hypothetical protein